MGEYEMEVRALGQAAAALFLGAILGWEREAAGKGAGLRTHMLICLSAMAFVKVGEFLILHSQALVQPGVLQADPVRIIEAIVTGLAFIGAGTIFRDRDRNIARGLTTAASMLAVATIGVAVGVERYVFAAGLTVIVWAVLRLVTHVEEKFLCQKKDAASPPRRPEDD